MAGWGRGRVQGIWLGCYFYSSSNQFPIPVLHVSLSAVLLLLLSFSVLLLENV